MFPAATSTTTSSSAGNNSTTKLSPTASKVLRQDDNNQEVNQQRQHHDTLDDPQENTSVCSSVSSLTDEVTLERITATAETASASASAISASDIGTKKKRSKFTITKATSAPLRSSTNSSSNITNRPQANSADAVSISFLSHQQQATSNKQPVMQVIQRALTGLRPGGIFFVLDYKTDDSLQNGPAVDKPAASTDTNHTDSTATTSSSTTTPSPSPSQSKSPQSCSLAMKEIPDELVQQWQLTMVPTNLETYYNSQQPVGTSKLLRSTHLPASKRIVRWMGFKPITPIAAAPLPVAGPSRCPAHPSS